MHHYNNIAYYTRIGLNLASADTVIFLDHDWNPMRDMQAMANE